VPLLRAGFCSCAAANSFQPGERKKRLSIVVNDGLLFSPKKLLQLKNHLKLTCRPQNLKARQFGENMKDLSRSLLAVSALILGLTFVSFGQITKTAEAFPNVKIKNFGQMDTNYFRGGQPKEDQYQSLKDLGVTTVIDLRNDSEAYEKPAVEGLGMKYINIPMDDAEYPSDTTVATILKELNDPANGTMYVHCKGGKHRAGVAGAVYRFNKYQWNYDQTMNEMLAFNFDTSWGRKVMKTFVIDYAAKMKNANATAASSVSAN